MDKAIELYTEKIAKEYSLQPYKLVFPEEIILKLITNKNKRDSMLDLGVGTGRTTYFFAPLFKQYYGIDIAPAMIEKAKEKFHGMTFLVRDARNISDEFSKGIDFIFFSDQGICFFESITQMQKFFSEVYELLDVEGIFAFAIHTMNGIRIAYDFRFPKNPLNFIPEYIRWKNFRKANGNIAEYEGKDYHIFNGNTLCTKNSFQLQLLKNSGFKLIRILDKKGKELSADARYIDACKDNTLHYICYK